VDYAIACFARVGFEGVSIHYTSKKCAFYIKEVDYRLTAKINFVRRYFLETETSSLQTLTEL
jgi:hypothetical protein